MNRHAELENCRLWANLALDHFGLGHGLLPVSWNGRLTSRMGQAKCRTRNGVRVCSLEFSDRLWERATSAQRDEIAAHEAAHGVVWLIHGPIRNGRKADHHGPAWQRTMLALGFQPKRCHSVDTSGLGRKSQIITCGRCGASLGGCTPRKAERFQASARNGGSVLLRCCGKVPASNLVIVDGRVGNNLHEHSCNG